MPFILAALGALITAYIFYNRARNAGVIAGELAEMAADVQAAARRFGFRRKTNVHPVETIEDPKLAVGAIATAFVEMDDLPTKDQRAAMQDAIRSTYGLSAHDTEEIVILGRWFVSECGGPDQAVTRLARKLYKLDKSASLEPLVAILDTTMRAGSGQLSKRQQDALDEAKRSLRVR